MKRRNLIKAGMLASLLGASLVLGSCLDEEDPEITSPDKTEQPGGNDDSDNPGEPADPSNPEDKDKPNNNDQVAKLRFTVDEFAEKYSTIQKGEKVTVTISDVTNLNISKLAETLLKMSPDAESADDADPKYQIALIMESDGSLECIQKQTFKDCVVLVEVTIPKGVYRIETKAFEGCTSLKTATLLFGETSVYDFAFPEYVSVELSVELGLWWPADIERYVNAFDDEIVVVDVPFSNYSEQDITDALKRIENRKVSLVIPNFLSKIGEGAFSDCPCIANVVIPFCVKEIGSGAFANCANLEAIYCTQALYDKYHDKYPKMVVKSQNTVFPAIEGTLLAEHDYVKSWKDGAYMIPSDSWDSGITDLDELGLHFDQRGAYEEAAYNYYKVLDYMKLLEPGHKYRIYLAIESETEGSIEYHLGDWDNYAEGTFDIKNGSNALQLDATIPEGMEFESEECHIMFWAGLVPGHYVIKYVALSEID